MNELKFVAPTEGMHKSIEDYRKEHFRTGEGEIYGAPWLASVENYVQWLQLVRENENPVTVHPEWVVSTTLCAVDAENGRVIGMMDIHHELNDFLKSSSGHISYGVRPSERNRGYGTQILDRALSYCGGIGMRTVNVICPKNNIAANRTIQKNGGIPMREFRHPQTGTMMVQYSIDTTSHMLAIQQAASVDALYDTVKQTLPDGRDVVIRQVKREDAEQIVQLFRRTEKESPYLTREPEEVRINTDTVDRMILDALEDPKRLLLVARLNQYIIGRCSVSCLQNRARYRHRATMHIEILQAYWNMGIGTAMLDVALGWAVEHGYEQVQVTVNADDAPAIALFEKFGFQTAGRLPKACKYADATYADLVIMLLQLQV